MAEVKNKQNSRIQTAPVFTWNAREFDDYKKDGSWFVIVVAVATAVAGFFFWQRNWTAMVVVMVAALAFIIQGRIRPKKIKVEIYRSGVVIDDKTFPFESLKSFWIIYGEHPKLRLERESRFSAPINVPIADEDPEQVRLFLAKFLPEDEDRGEDITDTISRWFRF